MANETQFDEPVLEDNYPVYHGYYYVVDGKVAKSPVQGTVADLKMTLEAREVCRCDAVKRELLLW